MGYALFAQNKLVFTAQLNSVNLQQTQRSNEQMQLATHTLSLQQRMSSIQSSQSAQLADLYELLSYSRGNDETGFDFSGLSAEEQKRLREVRQTYRLSANASRDNVNAKINEVEQKFNQELDEINRQIYLVSIKENAIEMEVKRLDTRISAIQKQLEAIEEAEGDAIDRATPKFKGVG